MPLTKNDRSIYEYALARLTKDKAAIEDLIANVHVQLGKGKAVADCIFYIKGHPIEISFDQRDVKAVRNKTVTGPRNPHKTRMLGKICEEIVTPLLRHAGFVEVQNLNHLKMNHPYADFLAERNGQRYFISVKARNKDQRNRKRNQRYKLISNNRVEDAIRSAEQKSAEFAFIAVTVDKDTYSAYFQTHRFICEDLGERFNPKRKYAHTAIPMSDDCTKHYEKLAKDEKHTLLPEYFSNQSSAS